MTLPIYRDDSETFEKDVAGILHKLRAGGLTASDAGQLDVHSIVADILQQVRQGGDEACAELTSKLDRADLAAGDLRVPAEKIAQAHKDADPDFLRLIRRSATNIRAYQESILHTDSAPLVRGGRKMNVRYTPVGRAGVYTPGGKGLYPSTVLMTVIPAQVAGVEEVVLVSPPTGGEISPMVLALAGELGIQEVYRLGGAVAVGALAYGTRNIRPVQKIVGPGNAFVAEAKRQVLGQVGIDSIAGPSEVLIVADETARADWVAADMLAQAEHNPGSAVLITPSQSLAWEVCEQLERQLPSLDRSEATAACLENYSAILVVEGLEKACDLADDFATEHLQIITADDAMALERIRNAGAIFVGPHTPVPLGDYYAGPSHVLPTGGTAKFFGPLSCNDFLKASSVIRYDAPSLEEDAADVSTFARREGFDAHARAVEIRCPDQDSSPD
jgi:histidinol dehydrogenase